MTNDAIKPSLWKKFSTWLKSTDERLKDTPLARWNEKHKILIMVTFFIVVFYAIYLAIVIHHMPPQNVHH